MKMTISVGRCLERKTMLVWIEKYIKEKEKQRKFKYWVLKVLYLETQMVCSGWLAQKWITLCVQRSSKCCVASWCNGLRSKRSFATLIAANAWSIGANLALALQFWRNFLIRNSKNMKIMRNLITVRGLRIGQHWQPLQPLTKNIKRLWLMLLMIY